MSNSVKTNPNHVGNAILLMLLVALGVWLFLPAFFVSEASIGTPNASVQTRVNITNSAPIVLNVTLNSPISLNANSTALAQCNVTVQDFNNVSDLAKLNVSFYHLNFSNNLAVNFNQTHYSNDSCTNFTDDSIYIRTYACTNWLSFNAQGGVWACNATVIDVSNANNTGYGNATIEDLISLGVEDLIDFGDMAVLQTSNDNPFNVTNYGNMPINVSVYGYGRVENDNLSFSCEQGNISIEHMRVSSNATGVPNNFGLMKQLNGSNDTRVYIPSLTIFSQNLTVEAATNTTIWKLFASDENSPGGGCNGTVVFTAERGI